nr:hypothetical protein [Tanacetum cinerariifolium]
MFARCLTTKATDHDQPPLQIMQMLSCFVNNVHANYAELLWEGLHYSLEHPSTLIPYLRFTKLIVAHYMTAYLEISRRVHDKYHNFENDDIVKSIFNLGKNKEGVGMKIPSWMVTDETKLTQYYCMYAEAFGKSRDDFEAHQNVKKVKEHLVAEEIEKMVEKIVVEQPMNVIEEEDETAEEDYELRRRDQADVARMIANAIKQEHENLRAKIISQINNAITNHITSQLALKIKFKEINTPCRSFAILLRDQDDPHDDAYPGGENSAKKQKTFEHGTYCHTPS